MDRIELLSPVGGEDSLKAAVFGGADAVYFGGSRFNARMNAKNFSSEALFRAIDFCHENGVKAYLTLNTLIYDRKLSEALLFAETCYRAGADALILADPGLASLIRRDFPDFELHASTQLSAHNALAGEEFRKMGFSRLVCARELTAENIRRLCIGSPIPVEMFVHGAICACHSGQCLMSSVIGARSGNRGECAQPCRLPYNGSYPLSFKDLSLAGHIREILQLGVESLKIEGRMKSPSYVYTVTRTFRTLLDEKRDATEKEMQRLASVFSRTGFTDGYFTGRIGKEMLGVRREEDKAGSEKAHVTIRNAAPEREAVLVHREEKKASPVETLPFYPLKKECSARFYDPASVTGAGFFDVIYLPLEAFDPAIANGFFLPGVITDGEIEETKKKIDRAAALGARHALVGNFGHLALLRGKGFVLHGDFRFNVYNSYTAKVLEELEDVILSPELNLAQMRDLAAKKSVIVYGRVPLMLLEKRVGAASLQDRKNAVFPVLREGKRDLVLNSVPLYMGDREAELKKNRLLSRHFLFTTESKKEASAIIEAYRLGKEVRFPVRRLK